MDFMFKVPKETIQRLLGSRIDACDAGSILEGIDGENPASMEDIGALIGAYGGDVSKVNEISARADEIKREVFGNRIKLFVPMYISNVCVNNCLYCSYRAQNRAMPRRLLTEGEFRAEIQKVLTMGYRVIEIVTGEDPELKAAGKLGGYVRLAKRELERVGGESEVILMSWALDDGEFGEAYEAGADGFYLWQETYDEEQYGRLHPEGTPKHDFGWRLDVFDRAIKSGIGRVGMGVLLGLADWGFDVLALTAHGKYLEETYGITVDAIGVPRFKYSDGAEIREAPNPVSDEELRVVAGLYRLAFPKSHIFLNTREKFSMMKGLLKGGGSEMNIACAVYPGGYTEPRTERQFDYFSYPTAKTLKALKKEGYEVTYFEDSGGSDS